MSILLKSLSPEKDAVLVTIAATSVVQELWESRDWVNPRVFLKAAQASLACLAVQGLNEEDSTQSIEMQWTWNEEGLKYLYADSLFQGAIRSNFSWTGPVTEDIAELRGSFKLRRAFKHGFEAGGESAFETSGIVDSSGDIVNDLQDILLKSDQQDCAVAISVRWAVDDSTDGARLKITTAHAYLLHVLPSPLEIQRESLLARWNNFLKMLSAPADWALSPEPEKATQEMANLIFASTKGTQIFSKPVMIFCNCTEDRVQNLVRMLSPEDLDFLEAKIEVACKYCGKVYLVDNPKSG